VLETSCCIGHLAIIADVVCRRAAPESGSHPRPRVLQSAPK
jgi:hypothetical protein